MIVLSDHSQSQVEREIDLFKAFDGFGARAAGAVARAPRRRAARDRGLPVLALGAGLRARPRAPRGARAADRAHRARARGRRPRHAPHRPPRRRGGDPRPPRRAALHARRHAGRPARASAGASRATSTCSTSRSATARSSPRPTRTRSAASGRRCAAAPPPRSCCRPARATSSPTGAATTTSAAARTGRCTPTTRSARCCGAARARTARTPAPQWSLRDVVPMVREHFGVPARVRAALLALAILLALAPGAAAQGLTSPARYDAPPPGWERAPADVMRAVAARPEVRRARRGHARHLRPRLLQEQGQAALAGLVLRPARARHGGRTQELSQTVVDDRSGRVLESWTGYKVEWTMARGYAGAFGRVANALWVWLPLCALFVLPVRAPAAAAAAPRPRGAAGVLGLLRVLQRVARSASRSRSSIRCSSTCSRACSGSRVSRARGREPPPLRLTVPVGALGIAAVFLLGVRCGLNVVGSNVIDVGYASVIGADHFGAGEPVYGHFPLDNSRGDTYGPVLYYAYVPFEALLPWSGTWDDLPAAHAAAVAFDLLTAGGAVAARPAPARAGPRRAARLRVGDVPVHAARGQLERQRRPRRAARHRRDAGAGAPGAARRRSWPRPR